MGGERKKGSKWARFSSLGNMCIDYFCWVALFSSHSVPVGAGEGMSKGTLTSFHVHPIFTWLPRAADVNVGSWMK